MPEFFTDVVEMAVAFSPVQSIPSSSIKLKNPQALSFRRNVFTHGKNEIFSTFTCPIRVDFKFPGRIPGEVIEPLRLIHNRSLSLAHSMFCNEKCFEILKLLHSFAAVTSPFQIRVILISVVSFTMLFMITLFKCLT